MTVRDLSEPGGGVEPTPPTHIDAQTVAELRELMSRYPQPRSALIPMLHLVQSVDGYVSDIGVQVCADLLGVAPAEVLSVATFYTMFKRSPAGQHHIGICRGALCAVLGGDMVWDTMRAKLGIEDGETTPDGLFSLEGVQCNAACDFAPVMMVDWEYMDNITPGQAAAVVDVLASGQPVRSTRGPTVAGFRAVERVLAGFPDGQSDMGPNAGDPTVRGVRIAAANHWDASGGATGQPAPIQGGGFQ